MRQCVRGASICAALLLWLASSATWAVAIPSSYCDRITGANLSLEGADTVNDFGETAAFTLHATVSGTDYTVEPWSCNNGSPSIAFSLKGAFGFALPPGTAAIDGSSGSNFGVLTTGDVESLTDVYIGVTLQVWNGASIVMTYPKRVQVKNNVVSVSFSSSPQAEYYASKWYVDRSVGAVDVRLIKHYSSGATSDGTSSSTVQCSLNDSGASAFAPGSGKCSFLVNSVAEPRYPIVRVVNQLGPFGYQYDIPFVVRHRFPDTTLPVRVEGPTTVAESQSNAGSYAVVLRWDDGSEETVASSNVSWSITGSNPSGHLVNSSGVLTTANVTALESIGVQGRYSLAASYPLYPDYQWDVRKTISIDNTHNHVTSLQPISGAAEVNERSNALYSVVAVLEDGGARDVTNEVTWSVDSPHGSFSGAGTFATGGVTANRVVTIRAVHPDGPAVDKPVTILNDDVALVINGASSLQENTSQQYSASIRHTNGSTTAITPTWAITGSAPALVNGSGLLSASEVAADTVVLLRAVAVDQDGQSFDTTTSVTIINHVVAAPDTDGDGVPDSQDAFPADRRYARDTNLNSLPDEWEAFYQLPVSCATANGDCDDDGMTNRDEFLVGRDPIVDEASVLMTVIHVVNGD